MAVTPYRGRESSVCRSRSSSLSSPTLGNFLYQEVFEISGGTLIRSYSCGQVFAKNLNGHAVQATQVRISNFISPLKNFRKLEVECNQKSFSVPKKMPTTNKQKKPSKAKMSLEFPITKKSAAEHEGSDSGRINNFVFRNMRRTIYLNLVILTVLSACFVYKFSQCNQHWNTEEIVHKLKESVFGQDSAILQIETILSEFRNSHDNVVMCFTGSTGVGKTFVSSIIYKNFPWVSDEYIDFFDSKTEESLRTNKYSSCGVNLLVIDGISPSVSEMALNNVKFLIDRNNVKFFIILIFRTHAKQEDELVMNMVKNMDYRFHYIPFKELNQQEIRKCFLFELKRQNKMIPQIKLNELLTDQMKSSNISKSLKGCKNVFHEVSRLS